MNLGREGTQAGLFFCFTMVSTNLLSNWQSHLLRQGRWCWDRHQGRAQRVKPTLGLVSPAGETIGSGG